MNKPIKIGRVVFKSQSLGILYVTLNGKSDFVNVIKLFRTWGLP